MLALYEEHTRSTPCRRDLRFKPQVVGCDALDEIQQFTMMPMGDTWDDASLLGPLRYLMNSSRFRCGLVKACFALSQ